MTSGALLMVLSAVDGGVSAAAPATFTDAIYGSCPDAPPSVDGSGLALPDGGTSDLGSVLLPPLRSARIACLMETCDTDRMGKQKLLDGPAKPLWWVGWVAALSLGMTFGLGVAQLWELLK